MKLKEISLHQWFIIIVILIFFGIRQTNFDPTNLINKLSFVFILFPLTLLGIFSHPKTRNSVKKYYLVERELILKRISELRTKQEKIRDLNKQISMDREIISLREEIKGFSDDRFEQCIKYSLVLLITTIVLTYFDLGIYFEISNTVFIVISFMMGLYYVFYMVESILGGLNLGLSG